METEHIMEMGTLTATAEDVSLNSAHVGWGAEIEQDKFHWL